ncbi:MAG: MerR family transcriptional regulator, partial [Actinomycetota bacterium]|nr:MerR family transcriptional regulator [Actinomycetota bacterium]
MAETDADYLSIGEVLGLLVEEFPEVTISKIRFLESQGLINPERTTSGYRKFHELDVELLRVILTEQRENYLPLRVIKDRIDTGEIDPSSEISRPQGIERPNPREEIADPASHPSARTKRPTGPISDAASTADVIGFGTGLHLDRGDFRSM